jgi:23S rRNA pseudouridine1911/1915/1917 synthase
LVGDQPPGASGPLPKPKTFIVPEPAAGKRLDAVLAELSGAPRSQVQRHIRDDLVRLDQALPAQGQRTRVKTAQRIDYIEPETQPMHLEAEDLSLELLFEDAHLLIVNKPSGMVVHPSAGHARSTLVHGLLHHLEASASAELAQTSARDRPGIVHRLDKDTSGALVVAKSKRAFLGLVKHFQDRTVQKTYWAVVHGIPSPSADLIETAYGRHPRDRKRFTSRVLEGKPAVTAYRVLERYPGASFVEVDLRTGRTHQIRVHLSERGHPLVGDPIYGRRRTIRDLEFKACIADLSRTALHARAIGFEHPITGARIDVEAPLPADLEHLLTALRTLHAARTSR